MNKIMRSSVVLVLMAFLLSGCNKNTPKEVAYNWLIAFNHLDFDEARKLSTQDTKNLLSSLQQLTDKVTDANKKEMKKVTVTIKDVKVDGDKAVVTYIASDNPKEQPLNLVKQGNNWLVLYTKIDLMGDVPDNSDDMPATGADSTGAAPATAPQEATMTPDTTRH